MDDLRKRLTMGQLDIVILPPTTPKFGEHFISLYKEPLCFLPSSNSPLNKEEITTVSMQDARKEKLILPIDACGLRGVTRELFADDFEQLSIYPGQATSYNVVESWAEIGIGSGILPVSKISSENRTARPLLDDEGEPAIIEWEATWMTPSVASRHVENFVDYMQQAGPIQ